MFDWVEYVSEFPWNFRKYGLDQDSKLKVWSRNLLIAKIKCREKSWQRIFGLFNDSGKCSDQAHLRKKFIKLNNYVYIQPIQKSLKSLPKSITPTKKL